MVYLKQEKIVVGYARVSTQRQSLRRQIENLKTAYPNIVIVAEVYTGSTDNRPKWKKLMRQCRAGNVSKLVFDEVSRFSRNAEEAIVEYKELYSLGIELEFLKEPHINSKIYRDASERKIEISTDSMDSETAQLINTVIGGLNDYLLSVAEKQIFLAFDHAQKERELLSKRTSEGLKQAKLMGSKVGRQPGQKLITKKQKRAKRIIRNHYELFGGELTATQCFTLAQITKSTFYRYLNEMREEDKEKGIIWDDEIIAEKIDRGEADPKKIIQVIKANKENNMTGRKL
ncbi:recombinase family protein [Butyrivibrio proteoclasticus]|uniref:recombinase family protein n=1 Tax=Butyrivibrio proteoclasticus TaxID=43305 RepID=UPI002ADD41F2|nr:recombinase family protein [Butyrivibrio proteoclasticus]